MSTEYRWNVAARCTLAFLGGFIWVSLFGAASTELLARVGLISVPQGVHTMTLFSFVGWTALAMWIFYHPVLQQIAWWMLTSAVFLAALITLLKLT